MCPFKSSTIHLLFSVMVFAVVEKAGTVVMNDQEELDSWSVIINGEVRIDRMESSNETFYKYLKCGDSFGITPTMEKMLHSGVMKTIQDDCQFVCITQVYDSSLCDNKTISHKNNWHKITLKKLHLNPYFYF